MKAKKRGTMDLSWVEKARESLTVATVPEDWLAAAEIATALGVSDTAVRNALGGIEDPSLVMTSRRGNRRGRYYNWPEIQKLMEG